MKIAFEKEEIAKPKIKLWMVIVLVVLIIIISFVIFKIISRNSAISEFKEITSFDNKNANDMLYQISKANTTLDDTSYKKFISSLREGLYKELMRSINLSSNGLENIYATYTQNPKVNEVTDLAQARASVQEQREIVLDNINKLESTGEIIIYKNISSYKCPDGKTYNHHPQSDFICSFSIFDLTKGERKAFSVNGSYAVRRLFSSSARIHINEHVIDYLGDIDKNPDAVYFAMLSLLYNELLISGSLLFEIINSNEASFDKDVKSEMRIITEEANKMPLPSEEAIKNLDINKMKKECSDLIGESEPTLLKVISSECEKLALENQKHALDILQRSKNEENPFILMSNKAYLYSLENCYNSTFIPFLQANYLEEGSACMEKLFANLKTRLSST